MEKPIKYLDLEGLKALYGVVDGKISTAVNNAKTELKGTATAEGDTLGKLEGKINDEVTRATRIETELSGKIDAINGEGPNSIDGKITAAVDGLKNGAAEGYDTLKGLEGKIKDEATRATAAEQALSDKIDAMDLPDTAVDGEFITTVSQLDGKVAIARAKVASDKVTAVAVSGGADTVAIEGTTVDAQIKSLGKTLKSVEGNAAKYKVVKLSPEEVADLKDANVKEAYRVVSYVGADVEGTQYTTVGETIKIYKDAHLEKAELGKDEDAQKLILTYILADGSTSVVKLDFAAIAFNTEFKNGLQVAENGEISVKIDAASEGFLTVGADGVKLAGVQEAINTAVDGKNVSAEGDAYVSATASNNKVTVASKVRPLAVDKTGAADSTITGTENSLVDGKEVADKVASFTNARISEEIAKLDADITSTGGAKVTVEVSETDGKITAVNVTESDIASATALTAEIGRAQAAEKKNADAIDTMSVNTDTQTVKIKDNSLTFTALTNDEIKAAWNDKV